jgi:ubiquinone/menaquinone biosynthesis C-methylase UbiE
MNLYKFFENPWVYKFIQELAHSTVSLYAEMAVSHVGAESNDTILDIGSGLGTNQRLFPKARYTGIDINPDYVAYANRMYGDGFRVMDAGRLDFPEASFDHAISIAVCHHLDDETLSAMVQKALRIVKPTGALHIIDPVLPPSRVAPFKQLIFKIDRGRHQRTLQQMEMLLAKTGRIVGMDFRRGSLHDVCYFRLVRAPDGGHATSTLPQGTPA